jgi:tRNA-dihydrouridine synthase 3
LRSEKLSSSLMATVAPRSHRKLLRDLALIVLTVLFQLSTTIMSFTLVTSRTRRLVQSALQDARSGFSKHPHEALSTVAGVVAQPQLSVEEFQIGLQNQLILAPLTRGGNLPFRRLCATFNSNFTMSEMAYARNLFKGYHKAQKKERALAKKGPTEKYFGFQIATKSSDEALRAAELAVKEGATWIDLNCGCPIYEATRRGLGAAMLKRPSSLVKLVGLTVASTPLPMTVKIRLGVSDSKINAHQVVEGLVNAGVAAVTVHGRTMEQRYTRPADWNIISDIARTAGVPIIGNGDILTWFEAEDRMQYSNNGIPNQLDSATGLRTGVTALMAGRGALIKPWIFKEWADKKSWFPTAEERVAVYWQLSANFKDHFGADEHGKRHAFYFLPWHFEFFCRYRPLPDEPFRELSRNIPLIQNSRSIDEKLIEIGLLSGRGEPVECRNKLLDSPLERLLRCEVSDCHMAISEALWAANTSEEAVDALLMMAHSRIAEFELQQQQGSFSSPSVRGKGVQRNNGDDDEGRPRGRSDESSWEVGGSGPRGSKAGPESDVGGNDDEGDSDLLEDDTESFEDQVAVDSDTGSIRGKLAEKSRSIVRSNTQGRVGGRGSSGISPAEMALPFVEVREDRRVEEENAARAVSDPLPFYFYRSD